MKKKSTEDKVACRILMNTSQPNVQQICRRSKIIFLTIAIKNLKERLTTSTEEAQSVLFTINLTRFRNLTKFILESLPHALSWLT